MFSQLTQVVPSSREKRGKLTACPTFSTDSLTPATEFAQKQVGMVARVAYVFDDGLAADFAGVFNNQIAVAEEALRDGGRDGHVLYVAQGDVARGARDKTAINLDLGVGQRVANRVALEVVVSG